MRGQMQEAMLPCALAKASSVALPAQRADSPFREGASRRNRGSRALRRGSRAKCSTAEAAPKPGGALRRRPLRTGSLESH